MTGKALLMALSGCVAGLPLAGQVFVASDFSHEVYLHDGAGLREGTGAWVGPASGGLDQPHGILYRTNDLLVASFGDDTVKRFDAVSGAYLGDFIPSGDGLQQPVYLEPGPDGRLYVSSQGDDKIRRYSARTGAALDSDAAPFIGGGMLDGPSGFDWSPEGSVLYVAGRNSANILRYDAATGAPLGGNQHVMASGLGVGSTFGLAVDDASGDVFVATGGNILRYQSNGTLVATIPLGAVGLEPHPDGSSIVAATGGGNNLRAVLLGNNSVTGQLLAEDVPNFLNFFHFAPAHGTDFEVPVTTWVNDGGEDYFALQFMVPKNATDSVWSVQRSPDLLFWNNTADFTGNGTEVLRSGTGATVAVGAVDMGDAVEVTERDAEAIAEQPRGFYRLRRREE